MTACFSRSISPRYAWPASQTPDPRDKFRSLRSVNSSRLTTFRLLAKYRLVNKVFKALSDPTRRRVLQLLRERPMSAGELSDHFAVSKPTMSAHFAVLQEAGLIEAEKSGRTIIYRLVMSVLEEALLGFAQTFGWGLESKRATRVTHHKLAKRPAKGEV